MGTGVLLGVIKMLGSNYREVMIVQYCECTKCRGIVHFKMVNLMLCEFYHKKKSINRAITLLCSEASHGSPLPQNIDLSLTPKPPKS